MNPIDPSDAMDVSGLPGEARYVVYRDELTALILQLSHELIRVDQGGIEGAICGALQTLGRFVGASSCYLFEFDSLMASASKRYEWCAVSVPSTLEAFAGVTPQSMRTLFPRAAAGETVRVDSLDQMGDDAQVEREKLAALSIGAFLFVPMKVGGRVIGLVGFDQHGGGRAWTDEHELLLKLAADMLVQAIERRGAHDRLEFHVNNAPLGVIEWDDNWLAQRWSPTAEQIFGWPSREVIGRSWSDWRFVHDDDLPLVMEITQRLIDGKEDSNICLNRNYTRDGQVISCEWFNSVLRDHAGRVVSILSFVQDVTQAQQVQQELVESQAELKELHTELQTRADEALRESELRYGYLADHVTDMISCHSLDGTYRYASQASEPLTGYRPDELLGTRGFEMIHPDDRGQIEAGHARMLHDMKSRVITYRLRHKDGHYVWVETTGRVMEPRGTDTERQIVAVSRDASSRKQAEQALRESEERYRALAEHATDMISRHDDEGRFTYLSPACRRLLGFEPEELVGQLPRVIAHPDDRDAVIQSLHRLRATTDVVSTTFRALRKDGGTLWLESSSRNDGQGIVVVSRDVSARMEAEQALRLVQSAVEQVGESVVITDNQLAAPGPHIVYVNPAFTRMTGYELDEVLGSSPRILQGPHTEKSVIASLRSALTKGEEFVGETTNYRKDGRGYVVEWNVNPLLDRQGNITHWVAIQRDITARRTARDLERLHREELAHVTRLSTMGEMASGLAHELNQPLTAINNYTNGMINRLRDDRLSQEGLVATLQRVADQSDRAGQMIRRIRAFVTKRGTVRVPAQVNDLVRETIALAETDIHANQARIDLDLAEGLPGVNVDTIQIEQVLINLVRNALEAMEGNAPEDRVVSICSTLDAQHRVLVTVHDRGPGLTNSQRDHLFDPFFTTKDEGMGMGLTISQSIIHAHSGRLWVAPTQKRGTTFHLALPVATGQAAKTLPGETPVPPE